VVTPQRHGRLPPLHPSFELSFAYGARWECAVEVPRDEIQHLFLAELDGHTVQLDVTG
jgi:hypothetical protein